MPTFDWEAAESTSKFSFKEMVQAASLFFFKTTASVPKVTPYLWAWGIGGVIGNLSIGTLIDRIGRPSWIIGGILALLALAMFSLPLVLGITFLAFLPFMVWGEMG
ncbi:hypothetical protein PD280_22240 [Virgibacillus salarius]|uniref:hypothetical protein n=1 Tax=Virgibacillus salarius TaxID=447199 RepID=UPI00248FDE87|nr:hypothetical protein [Virgibacillus salarius]WBX80258.1 hypothetical protein PD280_22240 [Virgibacillus salarius]